MQWWLPAPCWWARAPQPRQPPATMLTETSSVAEELAYRLVVEGTDEGISVAIFCGRDRSFRLDDRVDTADYVHALCQIMLVICAIKATYRGGRPLSRSRRGDGSSPHVQIPPTWLQRMLLARKKSAQSSKRGREKAMGAIQANGQLPIDRLLSRRCPRQRRRIGRLALRGENEQSVPAS